MFIAMPQMWQCAEHAREQYHRPLRLRGGGSVFAGLQRDGRAGGFDVLFLGSGVSTGLYLSSLYTSLFHKCPFAKIKMLAFLPQANICYL